jgi:hypothetical protein
MLEAMRTVYVRRGSVVGEMPKFLRVPCCSLALFSSDCGRQAGLCAIVFAFILYRDAFGKSVEVGELAWFTGQHRGTMRRALMRLRAAGCVDAKNRPLLKFTSDELESSFEIDTACLRADLRPDLDKHLIAAAIAHHISDGTCSRLTVSKLGSMISRCAKTASKKLRSMEAS